MRNSTLLKNMKWAQNNKNNKLTNGQSEKGKKWIHNSDTLLKSHVSYLVKFLGNTEVDQPKGIEVVKQGIQKLKFNQEIKKSEGVKTPKVELKISVDGVVIQDPKSKRMLHQYPLHKISYCADDKAEKRFFSFIAKEGESNQHTCFVFVSDKLAEEITLTIGQAFELAYKKFLETSNKDMEIKKQLLVLQKRIGILESENSELKKRLTDIASIKGSRDVQEYMEKNGIKELTSVRDTHDTDQNGASSDSGNEDGSKSPTNGSETSFSKSEDLICIESTEVPAEALFEEFNDEDFDPRGDFNPRGAAPPPAPQLFPPALPPRDPAKVLLTPPPSVVKVASEGSFATKVASNPFATDPFGMSAFEAKAAGGGQPNMRSTQSETLLGFQSGLMMGSMQGSTTFTLDELDPLKN